MSFRESWCAFWPQYDDGPYQMMRIREDHSLEWLRDYFVLAARPGEVIFVTSGSVEDAEDSFNPVLRDRLGEQLDCVSRTVGFLVVWPSVSRVFYGNMVFKSWEQVRWFKQLVERECGWR